MPVHGLPGRGQGVLDTDRHGAVHWPRVGLLRVTHDAVGRRCWCGYAACWGSTRLAVGRQRASFQTNGRWWPRPRARLTICETLGAVPRLAIPTARPIFARTLVFPARPRTWPRTPAAR